MSRLITLYTRLLDEGVDVWRPVEAECLANGRYRVIGPAPETESWEFEPGTIVMASAHTFSGGEQGMIAVPTSN